MRWGDFDALGHLNHVSYLVYCDEARDAALAALGGSYVVAHQEIDYRREIPLGTRELVVRTRITRVGISSVHVEHDVADGAASAAAVVVAWDRELRTKRELTQAERDALTA
ncbi:MAG: acyl-CoA thioesterase [Actinomycetota bacterium]